MLLLDGVYVEDKYHAMRFHRVKAPTIEELNTLAQQISYRVTPFLEKKGLAAMRQDEIRLVGTSFKKTAEKLYDRGSEDETKRRGFRIE